MGNLASHARLILLLSVFSFAPGTAVAAQAGRLETGAARGRGVPVEVTAGGALAVSRGSGLVGVEAGFGALLLPELELQVGADFGTFVTTGPFALVFTAFPQVYRKWAVSDAVSLRAGFGMGPVVATGGGLSAVRFGAWAKAGFDAKIDRGVWFNFEPKIGVIGSAFAFVPQFGVTWAL